jgi:DNA excision repair protein ERCC-2
MTSNFEKKRKELLFPYETVRKTQENLILDIEKAIKEKQKLIVDAPTGLGKTISALGPALSHTLNKDLVVWFLTNRHTQHKLVVDTLKLIQEKYKLKFNCSDLIGKRLMCNQEVKGLYANEFQEFCKSLVEKNECEFLNKVKEKNKLTIEAKRLIEELREKGVMHNKEVVDICREKNFCSYEISLELGKKAKVIIGDYNYIFNTFVQQSIFKKIGKELEETILIVDEAHNLPRRIVEMLSHKLTDNMLKNAVSEAGKFGYFELMEPLKKIKEALEELNGANGQSSWHQNGFDKNPTNERLVKKEEFLEKIKDYEELTNELEVAGDEIRKKKRRSYIGGIAGFLEAWLGDDKGFTRIIGERESKYGPMIYLSYDCLDPGLITKGIFERVHSAVLMSGTLNPTFMYNDVLRVKGTEKNYPNPFPIENKLTLIVPETTTKYSLRGEAMFKKIGEKCSEMLQSIPGNCAVFFPSYYLRDNIGIFINNTKKKFWEKSEMNKEEKEDFLEGFKKEKDSGGVLLGVMGGSFGEGVDLPGDLLNAVIVVGVPLAKPDLKTKEIMKYFEDKFGKGWEYGYLYPAMSKCFQSAGRCIRSEEDKGVVIFLDERFAWQTYFCCFPKENTIVTKEFRKYLEEFF